MSIAGRAYSANGDPGDFELAQPTPEMLEEQEHHEEQETLYKPLKTLPWLVTIWAWLLLAIQGLVMGILYLNGGGRTARLEYPVENGEVNYLDGPSECFVAGGKPGVAEAVALRAVTAVVAQLIVFCVAELGLLKPHEAMWVIFAYFMKAAGKITECCCGIGASLPEVETTYVNQAGVERKETTRPGAFGCCVLILIWIILPASVVWSFTAFPATLNLMAVCDLVVDGVAIYLFRMGSLVFLVVCNIVVSCLSGGWGTESIVPFARVFVVVDSLTIGVTAVWGNYVQSGVVAGVFALLPLSNLILTGLELRG